MAAFKKSFKLIRGKKFYEEVKKNILLYMTNVVKVIWLKTLIVYLENDREPSIVFSFYVVLFLFFAVFFFENKRIKIYFTFFDLLNVIYNFFLLKNKYRNHITQFKNCKQTMVSCTHLSVLIRF